MEYENLRPLGIGEILDSALRIYRARFGALVAAVAFVVVPLHLVQFLFQISQPNTHIVRSQWPDPVWWSSRYESAGSGWELVQRAAYCLHTSRLPSVPS